MTYARMSTMAIEDRRQLTENRRGLRRRDLGSQRFEVLVLISLEWKD